MKKEWHGDAILKQLEERLSSRLEEIADEFVDTAQGLMGGESPSDPGNPPAVASGKVRDSIKRVQTGKLSQRAGSDDEVTAILEYGSKKMKPRPWALPALNEMKQRRK